MTYLYIVLSTIISGIFAWCFLDEKITDRICPGKNVEKNTEPEITEHEDDREAKTDIKEENTFARWNPSKQVHILITIGITAVAAGSNYQLFAIVDDPINIAKMLVVIWGVIAAGCIDLREQRIPNLITGIMALSGVALLGIGVISRQNGATAYITSSVFATVVSAILLLIVSVLTKHGIGEGDIKLICAMAILGGVNLIIGTLFFASVLSAVAAMFLVLVRKLDVKSSMAFGPFIMFGCLITTIMMRF